MKNSTVLVWGVLAFAFVCMGWFVTHTPMLADDYAFSSGPGKALNMLESIKNLYFNWDGRIGLYLINHTLLGAPKFLRDSISAIALPGILACVLYLLKSFSLEAKHTAWLLLLFFCCMIFIHPAFGQVFLWNTGKCYAFSALFAMVLTLPLVCLLREVGQGTTHTFNPWFRWLYPALCLFMGLTYYVDAGGLLVCQLYVIAFFLYRKKKIDTWLLASIVLSGIGIAVTVLAPGNFARAAVIDTPSSIATRLSFFIIYNARHLGLLYGLMAISLAALWFSFPQRPRGCNFFARLASSEEGTLLGMYTCASMAMLGVFLLSPVGRLPDRAITLSVVFFLVTHLLLLLLVKKHGTVKWAKGIKIVNLSLMCLVFLYVFAEFQNFRDAWRVEEQRAKSIQMSGMQHIKLKPLPIGFNSLYFMPEFDLSNDENHWINQLAAQYFGVQSVSILYPDCLYEFPLPDAPSISLRYKDGNFNVSVAEDSKVTQVDLFYFKLPRKRIFFLQDLSSFVMHNGPEWLRAFFIASIYTKQTIMLDNGAGTALPPDRRYEDGLPLFIGHEGEKIEGILLGRSSADPTGRQE